MGWLYLIADFSCGENIIETVLAAGVDYIQLREKDISSAEYLRRAKRLRQMTVNCNTKLIINDRLDIALLSGADGVHLGQSDIPVKDARTYLGTGKIIGATAKTVEQARQAMADGADYLGSGANRDEERCCANLQGGLSGDSYRSAHSQCCSGRNYGCKWQKATGMWGTWTGHFCRDFKSRGSVFRGGKDSQITGGI